MGCVTNINSAIPNKEISIEEWQKHKQKVEDQVDYMFIQRIIKELTQTCAINLPMQVDAIPPLILQAAQYFWENCDQAIEERWYCLPRKEFIKCGANMIAKLPPQILSVNGVYKTTDSFAYGVLGDFSLERMLLNNSAIASGVGGSLSDVYGSGGGYNLTDVTAALYEVQQYEYMFDTPLTYNYNQYSNELVILGALRNSDLMLNVYKRVKLQDLYKSYYFFRYCVCLGLRSMGQILGTFEFKLPGGVTLNYSRWNDIADNEMEKIDEWIQKNHAADYFINTNSI